MNADCGNGRLGRCGDWRRLRFRLGDGHVAARELIEQTIARSVESLDLLLAGEMERAMMKVHVKPPRPKPAVTEAAPGEGPAR